MGLGKSVMTLDQVLLYAYRCPPKDSAIPAWQATNGFIIVASYYETRQSTY
jgi:hypothetical protein